MLDIFDDIFKRYGYAAPLTCGWLPKTHTVGAIVASIPIIYALKDMVVQRSLCMQRSDLVICFDLATAALLGTAYSIGLENLKGFGFSIDRRLYGQ